MRRPGIRRTESDTIFDAEDKRLSDVYSNQLF